ncbi:glycoside hydrolase family 6 protein [Streptomyces sp. NPDC048512]|uniref:glycoside hydrolase family 6 protein n=1 Tax=Streptomyces sp. NPDC048512 TaxID=3365563 RepID=UPI00372131B8
MAGESVAMWPTGEADPGPAVRAATTAVARQDRAALFVACNIPHRDCGRYSAGGAADAEAYRRWIGQVADALAGSRALVVLEPDAIAHLVDGCTPGAYREERAQLSTRRSRPAGPDTDRSPAPARRPHPPPEARAVPSGVRS